MTLVRSRGPPNCQTFRWSHPFAWSVGGRTCQGVVYDYTTDYLPAIGIRVARLTSEP